MDITRANAQVEGAFTMAQEGWKTGVVFAEDFLLAGHATWK
jgi:hypothetical protein